MNKLLVAFAATAALGFSGAVLADAAGQFEEVCSDCHEKADFAGKSAADLEKSIKGISAGTIKHKGKIKLSDAEAKDMAAFLSK